MSARIPFTDRQSVIRRIFGDVYNWLIPVTAINMLWFLMSLAIILLPPATAGLFHTPYLMTRGETVSDFEMCFRVTARFNLTGVMMFTL